MIKKNQRRTRANQVPHDCGAASSQQACAESDADALSIVHLQPQQASEPLTFTGAVNRDWARFKALCPELKDNNSLSISACMHQQTMECKVLKIVNGADQVKSAELRLEARKNNQISKILAGRHSEYLILMEDFVTVQAHEQKPHERTGKLPWSAYSYMVLPFCSKGSLLDFILSSKVSQGTWMSCQRVRTELCLEVFKAVHFMHTELGIAHLDLKLDNYLVTDSLHTALIDFAGATSVNAILNTVQGTAQYCAPEVAICATTAGMSYLAGPADIFTLGVTCLCLFFGQLPLKVGETMAQWATTNLSTEASMNAVLAQLVPLIGEDASYFLLSCLNPNPACRPTIEQLGAHSPFIQDLAAHSDSWREDFNRLLSQ